MNYSKYAQIWIAAGLLFVVGACSDDDGGADGGLNLDGAADSMLDAPATDSAPALSWQQLGGQVSPSAAESEDPIMLAVDGKPAVGYRHAGFSVYLQVYDGGWGATASDPTGANTVASIYRAPDMCSTGSAIYMAYTDEGDATASDATFYDRIFVYRWTALDGWQIQNGGQEISEPWDSVSGIGYSADEAAIACRAGNASPAVAWTEVDATAELDYDGFASLLSGGTRSPRIDRDTDGAAGTDVRTIETAVAADGTITVAHFEDTGSLTDLSTQLFVTRYDGDVLENLGGAIDIDYDSNTLAPPALAIDGSDTYLAWAADRTDSGSRQIYVARWTGSMWSLLGDGPLSALGTAHFDANAPDLIVRDGVPTVAFSESDEDGTYIFVAEFRDGAWQIIGDHLNVDIAREALDPSLADVEGVLHVAFEEYVDGRPQIFVKRWQ